MTAGAHILVTGGSRGLGAHLVLGLLTQGYRVSTCSRAKTGFIDGLMTSRVFGGRFFWKRCQIGEAEEVESFVRASVDWVGTDGLYGIVNNAATAQAGILTSFPNVETERILRVNLLGAIQIARAGSEYLLRNANGGRIVNISSIVGSRGYNGLSAYSASKAGIDGLTRSLARELGRRSITVNSIAPGYMKTDMSSSLSPTHVTRIVKRTPLGRLPTEADVLGVVQFLLSPAAAMITGQTITVDGGATC
jgi:3-oxoacyl-[acyl-carrier protein] reductase